MIGVAGQSKPRLLSRSSRPAAAAFRIDQEMRVVLRCPNLARNGPTGPVWRCPFVGVDRKWSADGQNGANDGEFNRSLQHILRTSQPASDRARSFSAFH